MDSITRNQIYLSMEFGSNLYKTAQIYTKQVNLPCRQVSMLIDIYCRLRHHLLEMIFTK